MCKRNDNFSMYDREKLPSSKSTIENDVRVSKNNKETNSNIIYTKKTNRHRHATRKQIDFGLVCVCVCLCKKNRRKANVVAANWKYIYFMRSESNCLSLALSCECLPMWVDLLLRRAFSQKNPFLSRSVWYKYKFKAFKIKQRRQWKQLEIEESQKEMNDREGKKKERKR